MSKPSSMPERSLPDPFVPRLTPLFRGLKKHEVIALLVAIFCALFCSFVLFGLVRMAIALEPPSMQSDEPLSLNVSDATDAYHTADELPRTTTDQDIEKDESVDSTPPPTQADTSGSILLLLAACVGIALVLTFALTRHSQKYQKLGGRKGDVW